MPRQWFGISNCYQGAVNFEHVYKNEPPLLEKEADGQ